MPRKKKRSENAHLFAEFDRLNRLYFGGKLEFGRLTFADLGGNLGHTVRYRKTPPRRSHEDTFGILIDNATRGMRRVWLGTLLHEMVHLEQKNKYSCGVGGRVFNARMKELAAAGALNGVW
jgi:hypothetical protein